MGFWEITGILLLVMLFGKFLEVAIQDSVNDAIDSRIDQQLWNSLEDLDDELL